MASLHASIKHNDSDDFLMAAVIINGQRFEHGEVIHCGKALYKNQLLTRLYMFEFLQTSTSTTLTWCTSNCLQKVFGCDIDQSSHKGVLCVEHAGKSHEIYADGVFLTILVFTTTDKDPINGDLFVWHRLRNENLIADLDRRLKRRENSIPLHT